MSQDSIVPTEYLAGVKGSAAAGSCPVVVRAAGLPCTCACSAGGLIPMPVIAYNERLPPADLQGAGATLKPGQSCIALAYL